MIAITGWLAKGADDAALLKQARISKAKAEAIALRRTPHGTIKSAEIEKEKGHLVWSVDIETSGTRDVTEILVDAQSGQIVSRSTETPRQQAEEKAADAKGR